MDQNSFKVFHLEVDAAKKKMNIYTGSNQSKRQLLLMSLLCHIQQGLDCDSYKVNRMLKDSSVEILLRLQNVFPSYYCHYLTSTVHQFQPHWSKFLQEWFKNSDAICVNNFQKPNKVFFFYFGLVFSKFDKTDHHGNLLLMQSSTILLCLATFAWLVIFKMFR